MFFVKIYLSFRFLTVHPSSYSGRRPKNYCIDELTDYLQLQNKKIVAIDPGKCDLEQRVFYKYLTVPPQPAIVGSILNTGQLRTVSGSKESILSLNKIST